jgi:hypothetical protein
MIIFSSCSKNWDDIAAEAEKNTTLTEEVLTELGDLQAPDNFDWKTVKDVEITLTGSENGIVEASSSVGVIYQKAYLASNQPYTMKLTVPTYESTVQLRMNNRSESVSISSGNVSYSFN